MKKISIFNIKGGVGKTVSTINISAILAEKGYRILVVDVDPQSSTTTTFEAFSEDCLTVRDLLLNEKIDVKDVIKTTAIENIDILPCNFTLESVEKEMLIDMNKCMQVRLRNVLKRIEESGLKYDYCIIDCPPAYGALSINALVASNEVLIPIKIDKFALDGVARLIDEIECIQKEFNPTLKLRGCFVTMHDNTTINSVCTDALVENLGDKLFKSAIRRNVSIIESTFLNKPVTEYKKNANASKDYNALVEEVFNV